MMSNQTGLRIHVTGIVQGVGFRPFVYNLATSLGLKGWVLNSSSGVDIELSGSAPTLDKFLETLRDQPPYLARIDSIITQKISSSSFDEFTIRESLSLPGEFIPISPDMSICPDCRRELFSRKIEDIATLLLIAQIAGQGSPSLKTFPMIAHTPLWRSLIYALTACQSIIIRQIGGSTPSRSPARSADPKFDLSVYETESRRDQALQDTRQALADGKILAIKGLGGYHLACDASNPIAVENLRKRKKRSDKPFALMAFDTNTISKFAQITPAEKKLLDSPQHPIILLQKKTSVSLLNHTSPNQNHLGFMLPYTPLHLLLLEPATGFPEVLVMTSGNTSEEPIAYNDEDALTRLKDIADGFLIHNRPIHTRVDDSVVRVFEEDLIRFVGLADTFRNQ